MAHAWQQLGQGANPLIRGMVHVRDTETHYHLAFNNSSLHHWLGTGLGKARGSPEWSQVATWRAPGPGGGNP